MKLGFIGGGAMGEAMLGAIIAAGIATPEQVSVSDIARARREHLEGKYHVHVTSSNRQAISGADIVVLAIKPQNLVAVMAELRGRLEEGQLVLSIIAGARMNTLALGLAHQDICRVMPNTPARVGQGMSVWTASPGVTREQRPRVAAILGAMGKEIYVDDEKYVDMATAVSGSGPAYIFLVVECLTDAAVEIGLPREMAGALVLQTVVGSGRFLEVSGSGPAELRRMVTSPGGTTVAALAVLGDGDFAGLIKRAVDAAYKRALELGS